MIVGTALWVALSVLLPRDPLAMPNLANAETVASVAAEPAALASAGELKGIWERDLRQRLIEPEPAPKPKPKPPPPPPPVRLPRLLATFVENGQAWGLFVDQRGNQRVRSAEGRIDDFDIIRIDPGRAQLGRDGKTYDVKTVQEKARGHR
jgi:hypothetical protein